MRENGIYATSVHINNNIYSIFDNKTNLSGVNEFMNHKLVYSTQICFIIKN